METIIRIKQDELTPAFLQRIKSFFENENELEISISPVNDFGLTKKESFDEYTKRIHKAVENIESEKGIIAFSAEEFESLTNDLKKK
jgi:hypothetical protein